MGVERRPWVRAVNVPASGDDSARQRTPARIVIVALAAVLAAGLTARLGVWQVSRAHQKTALQATLDERSRLPPVDVRTLPRAPTPLADLEYRPATARGRWLDRYTVYLENRVMASRTGFDVVTPLELAPGDVVLVQRGWIPRNAGDRTVLAPIVTPVDEVQVEGRLAASTPRVYQFGEESPGAIRQNLDLGGYARETGLALRPYLLVQNDTTGAPPDGLTRHWPAPAVDIHRHEGYAFQWFSLSALITGLYVWFQLIRPWRQRIAR